MGCTRKEGKDKVTMEKCKCAGKYRRPDLVKSSHTLTAAKGEEKCAQNRKNEVVWEGVTWKRTKEREEDHRSIVQMAKCSLLPAQQLEEKRAR